MIKESSSVKILDIPGLLALIQTPRYKQKSRGELRTPAALINEILDQVPQSVWRRGGAFLDPCCGRGSFLVAMTRRLLKYHSPEKVSGMIHGVDIDPWCVYTTRIVLANQLGVQETQINVQQQDLLSWKPSMRFDVIVGNPPWDKGIQSSNSFDHSAGYIYLDFVANSLRRLLKENGHLTMVLPTSWLTLVKMEKFRKWLRQNYKISRLTILENLVSQKWFNVGTDCCVLDVVNSPAVSGAIDYSFEFSKTWQVDLDQAALNGTWPAYSSQADYDLHLGIWNDPRHKKINLVRPTDVDLTTGKGYIMGNVVGFRKDTADKFVSSWAVNKTLPVISEHSHNNQWAIEFHSPDQAKKYHAYASTADFQQVLKTLVPSFKLQPYLLNYIGYLDK